MANTAALDDAPGVPFARPFIGAEEEEAALRVLRSGWLTTGGEALSFEREFQEFLAGGAASAPAGGVTGLHCLAVNSATSGLHLALEACGVGAGDLALLPSYTFASTAGVVRTLGADPLFVDVVPGGFHIDPAALAETLEGLLSAPRRAGLPPAYRRFRGKKPKALIPVHYGGLPCDMGAIMDIARRYDLPVIEDAAHSFPSVLADGSWAGTIGDAGVFSFYATKTLTTGEGGMVVCKNEGIAGRVSLMRSHGIDRSVWNRYTDTAASWYYEVVEAGYKYNLPDILAALGRVQLSRAWELLSMRRNIAAAYDGAFGGDGRFFIPPGGEGDARHLYPLRLNPAALRISRDGFIEKLKERNIGVSVHFIPLHTMPFYKNRYSLAEADFPETMRSFRREISLPIWPGMSGAQVERVISVVKSIAGAYTV
ncbi:MAG: DegT/DnrJ/EryC1/StrS aminotransferase family protein [Treponema sp.]|jgi:dTDP-4-amino-4,6-dideoxygalactose transaminase|nr:DegT/DnrJ/EryC1/StrS aminotransferase family protein [Treponema sp.]